MGSRAGRKPPDGPDAANALSRCLARRPPARSISSRSVIPLGTSKTPGRFTSPLREKNRAPLAPLTPRSRYQAPPWSRIDGTQAKVSTLLTSVGLS